MQTSRKTRCEVGTDCETIPWCEEEYTFIKCLKVSNNFVNSIESESQQKVLIYRMPSVHII